MIVNIQIEYNDKTIIDSFVDDIADDLENDLSLLIRTVEHKATIHAIDYQNLFDSIAEEIASNNLDYLEDKIRDSLYDLINMQSIVEQAIERIKDQ